MGILASGSARIKAWETAFLFLFPNKRLEFAGWCGLSTAMGALSACIPDHCYDFVDTVGDKRIVKSGPARTRLVQMREVREKTKTMT